MVVPDKDKLRYPDLLPPTREALNRTGLPWVMENVVGAPMRPDFVLCGCDAGLPRLRRRRWFETGNWEPLRFRVRCTHAEHSLTILTSSPYRRGSRRMRNGDYKRLRVTYDQACEAMGISWMDQHGLGEAIPPAYTHIIGTQLRQELQRMRTREVLA